VHISQTEIRFASIGSDVAESIAEKNGVLSDCSAIAAIGTSILIGRLDGSVSVFSDVDANSAFQSASLLENLLKSTKPFNIQLDDLAGFRVDGFVPVSTASDKVVVVFEKGNRPFNFEPKEKVHVCCGTKIVPGEVTKKNITRLEGEKDLYAKESRSIYGNDLLEVTTDAGMGCTHGKHLFASHEITYVSDEQRARDFVFLNLAKMDTLKPVNIGELHKTDLSSMQRAEDRFKWPVPSLSAAHSSVGSVLFASSNPALAFLYTDIDGENDAALEDSSEFDKETLAYRGLLSSPGRLRQSTHKSLNTLLPTKDKRIRLLVVTL